ncbi:hypothetical protein VTN31DRAFT_4920 [Thermomyces dupontii]|uniref:uncharacterized protein n=1 Tax=Talaromyces thermophilus TaxID=28565 RepID=UPI0037432A23
MAADIANGVYRNDSDPPFRVYTNEDEEDQDPKQPQTTLRQTPGYKACATEEQLARYENLVRMIREKHRRANPSRASAAGKTEEEKETEEWVYARYCVDMHIHQHYLARRSILNLCRDDGEIQDLRAWQFHMALDPYPAAITASEPNAPAPRIESTTTSPFSSSPTSSTDAASSSSTARTSLSLTPCNHGAVAPAAHLTTNQLLTSFDHEYQRHQRLQRPEQRAERLDAVRRRYHQMMHERREQRKQGLFIAEYEATRRRRRCEDGICEWPLQQPPSSPPLLTWEGPPLIMTREVELMDLLRRYGREG